MKHLLAITMIAAVAASFLVVRSIESSKAQTPSVYFGYLLGSARVAAVAIDLAPPDANGQRAMRGYVCDGLGLPEGVSVWFRGMIDAQAEASMLTFSSVAGQEQLLITAMNERQVNGAFTDSQGTTARFVAYPAIDGAGIYQVTLDESLRYRGTSTDGNELDAQSTRDGTTTGTIRQTNGQIIDFTVRSLALASPAVLAQHGLPVSAVNYASFNQVPGEYTAVIAPGGAYWFGRDGLVRDGVPGLNIIGLDKKERGGPRR